MSNATTITNLQQALHMELTATHQYQLHAHMLDDWGLDILAEKMRGEMQEELGHSDAFIERILFLGGAPDLAFQKSPAAAGTLEEMFASDLKDETEAVDFYTKAALQAAEVGDVGSRTLFERILLEEEGHKAWLETQLSLLQRLGESAFSAKFVSGAANEA
ncbi:bacterioferritin [uncultured Ruegeria sp.]|uniref:bacterioferritin n=1 Tax=uncultured Ruegeria sp. TaxID=259304 RepID=UPI00261052A0|nr:bacterioferritin [uncultured Ruegeria sp.]